MMKKLYRDIKFLDGSFFLKGSMVEVLPITGNNALCLISQKGIEKSYRVRYQTVFKAPSLKMFEKWTMDDICRTPAGKKVEPDGYDHYGFPSWLLIAGLI